jgi:hypothetical protein
MDKIESLLYRRADIHGMGPFGRILAPQPYNKRLYNTHTYGEGMVWQCVDF